MQKSEQLAAPLAWLLAALVVAPLFVGAVAVWTKPDLGRPFDLAMALCGYAGVILAFLGGVRWGVEVSRSESPRNAIMILSALPAVTAVWGALAVFMIGPRWGFVMVIAAFAVLAGWDMRSQALPSWMGRLRTLISVGSVLAMLMALVGT